MAFTPLVFSQRDLVLSFFADEKTPSTNSPTLNTLSWLTKTNSFQASFFPPVVGIGLVNISPFRIGNLRRVSKSLTLR